jgi:hypothetical protein
MSGFQLLLRTVPADGKLGHFQPHWELFQPIKNRKIFTPFPHSFQDEDVFTRRILPTSEKYENKY